MLLIYYCFSRQHVPTNSVAPLSPYKHTHDPQFLHLQGRRPTSSLPILPSVERFSNDLERHGREYNKHTKNGQRSQSSLLRNSVRFGFLMEEGAKLFKYKKLRGLAQGTFEQWILKNVDL